MPKSIVCRHLSRCVHLVVCSLVCPCFFVFVCGTTCRFFFKTVSHYSVEQNILLCPWAQWQLARRLPSWVPAWGWGWAWTWARAAGARGGDGCRPALPNRGGHTHGSPPASPRPRHNPVGGGARGRGAAWPAPPIALWGWRDVAKATLSNALSPPSPSPSTFVSPTKR